MAAVMENVSAHPDIGVMCNECESSGYDECGRGDYGMTNKRHFISGRVLIHCFTCHSGSHRACLLCGACMSGRARLDRVYCSSTCRVRALKERERNALENAAAEAENDAVCAALVEDAKRFQRLADPAAFDDRQRKGKLRATASNCSECARLLGADDVVYRRRQFGGITDSVLPYCEDCRCGSLYHNRDARPGWKYRRCTCDDWGDPEPCVGCSRLVRHPDRARWRAPFKDWCYSGEKEPSWPRVFCSDDCKKRVLADEARARRAAARANRPVVKCEVCRSEFRARPGARYCAPRCRQKAYRMRRGVVLA